VLALDNTGDMFLVDLTVSEYEQGSCMAMRLRVPSQCSCRVQYREPCIYVVQYQECSCTEHSYLLVVAWRSSVELHLDSSMVQDIDMILGERSSVFRNYNRTSKLLI
jgi:hypothetical protein